MAEVDDPKVLIAKRFVLAGVSWKMERRSLT